MSDEKAVRELRFSDLVLLEDREMQILIRDVARKDLVLALKGASQEVQRRVHVNVSKNVERMIREGMDTLGSPPKGQVEESQSRIVQTLLKLIQAGHISSVENLLRRHPPPVTEEQLTGETVAFLERIGRLSHAAGGKATDLSTVAGTVLAILVVGFGVQQGLAIFRPMPALGFVRLGAVATVLIGHSFRDVCLLGALVRVALLRPKPCVVRASVDLLVECTQEARRMGILKLQYVLDRVPSDFVRWGMTLATDGVRPQEVQRVLGEELGAMEARHRARQTVVETAGVGGALFGALGLVMGMILSSGRTAFIPLFWGGLLWGFCHALRMKLRARTDSEIIHMRIIMAGILEIQSGTNPSYLQKQLLSRLPPDQRRPIL